MNRRRLRAASLPSAGALVAAVVAGSFLVAAPPASAAILLFRATLSGGAESPPVITTGRGSALVTYDGVARTLRVQIDFEDLIGNTTVAHIHAPTAVPGEGNVGVATFPGTFPGFPAGTTSGSYDGTVDLSAAGSYTGGFLVLGGGTAEGAEAALVAAMKQGRAYVNVHSTFAPGGEIRGFLSRVPEGGATLPLMGIALAGLACVLRRAAPLRKAARIPC